MAKLLAHSSSGFLLVLLISVVWMQQEASAQLRFCSVELDATRCLPQACATGCSLRYGGVGECAHQENLQSFHCVCLYACL